MAETLISNAHNPNKQARIDQLHSEISQEYHIVFDAASDSLDKNITIKRSIQKVALAYEEIYKLHEQEWMIQEIGSIIIKDLKTRGFPESKYKYVYRALEVYDDRFVKSVEQSSIQTVDSSTKRQELFYKTKTLEYYEALQTLNNFKNDIDFLPKKDVQHIVPKFLDLYDDNIPECKAKGILIIDNKANDFYGGPELYEDPLSIEKPIPRVPEKLVEEFTIWIKTFLPSLIQKFTDYPVPAPLEKRMAAGWAAVRHAHDPTTDDKYRKSYYDWINIVEFADDSFKHHAASHFKTQDFKGRWRKLTREQIGARQKTIPQWCKWFFETVPGFMEEVAWSRQVKEGHTSAFSIDLSPKLSDRSIR